MFARSLIVLVAATAIAAWPIAFYPSSHCDSEPVFVLHHPPRPGSCSFIHSHPPVKSYSGGTEDKIQKLLIYYDRELCYHDSAHHVHSNHTINNSPNQCITFEKSQEIPRAFSLIEEFLPIETPKKNASSSCNKLVVQT